ncbi:Fe-S cluster assembly protein SufD [Aureliella helgolandensis]|uniref:FeS cluster assembly protein SufB n=1 Tax=Aureliella helgolandensis TaxID=2527968 RepID=A0A518GCF7_9BACT|nr:Fe-S cluster assembly protein SufD [Aureliella helgolandensis]QDV26286.1 FeS cluster assembly protein SufB [Aureliella helgolandensis]
MTTTEAQPQSIKFDAEGFEQFLAASSEPSWLVQRRRDAWKKFEELAWPDRKQEEWMRSDLRGFKLDNYALASSAAAASLDEANVPQWLASGIQPAGTLQTLNGRVLHSNLDSKWSERGVLFGDLSSLASEHSEIVEQYLHTVVDPNQDRFAALHAATWNGGQLLYVPKGVCIDQPLYVAAGMSDGGSDQGHTLIVIEEGAEATFLYECNSDSPTAKGLHNGAVEIVVKPGGHLRYVNLQDWGRGVWHFAHQRATIDRDATIQWTIAALGTRFSQVGQSVSLVGKGAHSQVNGVLFTQGQQQLTYNTFQHHQAPHCRSDFLYKSALQDKSRTVWRGMIGVDAGAQKTDGYQRNDNLLLSEHARADSIPGLEILADDVRCTHGSTSGKVDEELIFYAQSRGFTRKEAVRMIVTGFFQQIFDRITIESVRESLGQSIARQVREYQ